jgi:hypothetical protein
MPSPLAGRVNGRLLACFTTLRESGKRLHGTHLLFMLYAFWQSMRSSGVETLQQRQSLNHINETYLFCHICGLDPHSAMRIYNFRYDITIIVTNPMTRGRWNMPRPEKPHAQLLTRKQPAVYKHRYHSSTDHNCGCRHACDLGGAFRTLRNIEPRFTFYSWPCLYLMPGRVCV